MAVGSLKSKFFEWAKKTVLVVASARKFCLPLVDNSQGECNHMVI